MTLHILEHITIRITEEFDVYNFIGVFHQLKNSTKVKQHIEDLRKRLPYRSTIAKLHFSTMVGARFASDRASTPKTQEEWVERSKQFFSLKSKQVKDL